MNSRPTRQAITHSRLVVQNAVHANSTDKHALGHLRGLVVLTGLNTKRYGWMLASRSAC